MCFLSLCVCVVGTSQKQKNIAGALAFWMANASELLNFIKQDRDLSRITLDAQDILAHLVQMAFKSVCVYVCVPCQTDDGLELLHCLIVMSVVFNKLRCVVFRYLVHCLQADLNNYMPAFLDDPEEHNPQRPKIGKIQTHTHSGAQAF